MTVDITYQLTREQLTEAMTHPNEGIVGHAGTHFDVMDKEFPLEYTQRRGIVFDVSAVAHRDIDMADIALDDVEKDMFVAFRTGFIETVGYGEKGYYSAHPQLSYALIDALLEKGVSVIGLDFAGIRRTPEHIPADQRCADKGVFVIENLCCLDRVLAGGGRFTAHTYPLRCSGITGLPCRVIAEIASLV